MKRGLVISGVLVLVLFNFSFSASAGAFYKGASSRGVMPVAMLLDWGVDTACVFFPWGSIEPVLENPHLTVEEVQKNPWLIEEYSRSHDWAAFDNLIQPFREKGLRLFVILGGGLNCDLPKFQGAVATPDKIGRDYYLGHIFLFASATARRYKEAVRAFFLEDELNEAGLAALLGWREPCVLNGCWSDFGFLTELFKTLSGAIRQEAPHSLVGLLLHTDIPDSFHWGLWSVIAGGKNFVEIAIAWKEYYDVIGMDFFPNYYTALPVYYDDVGNRIGRIRAALPEKPVVVLETGYPVPQRGQNPHPVDWNEERQAVYVEGAICSAIESGAEGFFYFNPEGLGCGPPPGGYTPKDLYALEKLGLLFRQGNTVGVLGACIELGLDYLFGRFRTVLQAAEGYGFFRPDGSKRPAYFAFQRWYKESIPKLEKAGFFNETDRGFSALKMAPQKAGPLEFALLQNYPNPFNPETWIPYVLAKDQKRVTIEIYTATGQLVRRLNLGDKRVSAYLSKERAAYWDGKNETGEPVASGVYFYNLRADGVALGSRRLVILR